ncbi:MAG: ABC transporter ATP-binding protein/permease [Mogibacterium sp.]|nr:ABC transporter ATP-binding protein/permease [Mogibacterium sp.]
MKNLFKNLLPYKWIALLILLLLFGQAFCDMNLPQYTQKMIDVGIQNRGIEHVLPQTVESDEFDELYDLCSSEQKELLNIIYAREDGVYQYDEGVTEEMLTDADGRLLDPVVTRYKQLNKGAAETEAATEKAANLDDFSDEAENATKLAMGCAYAAHCDEAAGLDVNSIQNKYMWKCGLMMFLMALLMLICTIATSFLSSRIGAGIGKDLRGKLFRNVMSFSTFEMDSFHTSSLITRATNDIQHVQMASTMLLRMMLYSPCICIWAIIKVAQTHAHMNFIIATGTIGLLLLLGGVMTVVTPKFKIMQSLVDGLNSVSREILTGIHVIRAVGREKTEEHRFNDANRKLYKNQLFTSRMMTLLTPIMMIVMYGLAIWIMWVGSDRIDTGTIQVGALTAFISYAMMIVSSFLMIAGMFLFLPRAGVAADRIEEVISTQTSITNAEDAKAISRNAEGIVKFDHVSFKYPDAEENVLDDIDFEAKPGETTAIIGATGCGKSTLIDLIPRFYDVTEGMITIDGKDIRGLKLESLRHMIGYVPQKGILFSGTIESNIRYGKMNASDEEVAEAARIAQADSFIEDKEDKYESYIAQGGSNVSGGQRQRLAIARALAKKPKILIFDDSFSALDMKTDAELRKALAAEAADATKIIVAQRVGTILHAEQIIVLDDGRIVGKGTHEELMKNCAVYREIAESQLSEKELYS